MMRKHKPFYNTWREHSMGVLPIGAVADVPYAVDIDPQEVLCVWA